MDVYTNIAAPKKRKPKGKVSAILKTAAREYKEAYRAVYGMEPVLTYDGTWIRIQGVPYGVKTKRLKELTTQLRNRLA